MLTRGDRGRRRSEHDRPMAWSSPRVGSLLEPASRREGPQGARPERGAAAVLDHAASMPVQEELEEKESLSQAVSHILEEARTVVPGIQALLGFQLVAVF